MNKKIILLTLLSTACLASCTPSLPDSSDDDISTSTKPTKEFKYKGKNVLDNLGSDTGTIKFQVGGGSIELQLWDTLISEFEKENEGIKIEKVTINGNSEFSANEWFPVDAKVKITYHTYK